MRILLLGDYSNYHACLSAALHRLGHDVVVASDGSRWMDTTRSVDTSRNLPGMLGGAWLYAKLRWSKMLRGFDVVQIISPSFVTLRPRRLRSLYKMLRRHNGKVILCACGTDKAFMDMICAPDCSLPYSEYRLPSGKKINSEIFESASRWQQGAIGRWCDEVYGNVDGVTTALLEYHLAMQRIFDDSRLKYIGIPIDLHSITPIDHPIAENGRVKLFLGRHRDRKAEKGTDIMEEVATRVCAQSNGRASLDIVENLSYAEYIQRMRLADVVLDQMYSLTPATNALLAMAAGQCVVSGGEEMYYDFIAEKTLHPIFNTPPTAEGFEALLRNIINNPEQLRCAADIGREFVARHNDSEVVANRCIEFWESL